MKFFVVAYWLFLGSYACTQDSSPLSAFLEDDATYRASITSYERSKNIHALGVRTLRWGEGAVEPAQWSHRVRIYRPNKVRHHTAFLYIGGGILNQPTDKAIHPLVSKVAEENGVVGVEVLDIPNQGLRFFGEEKERYEDDLIAYSWKQYLATDKKLWMVNFAMVKAVDLIMDLLQRQDEKFLNTDIQDFVVAGQSKRGWTTWLLSGHDRRVRASVPMVADFVNVIPSMNHHKEVYGSWSPPLKDYVKHGIAAKLNTSEVDELMEHVDPYRVRRKLTMPKFIVNAANDEFFLPESSSFYFAGLPGEKFLFYIPNSGHRVLLEDYAEAISSFVAAEVEQMSKPEITWSFERTGWWRVSSTSKPDKVSLWVAHNPKARDFRFGKQAPKYVRRVLKEEGDGVYVAQVKRPQTGWKASFVEVAHVVAGKQFKQTTPVEILGSVGAAH